MDIRTFFKLKTIPSLKTESSTLTEDELSILRNLLINNFHIGFHASKHKTLMDTINALTDIYKPYKIFLGSPKVNRLQI